MTWRNRLANDAAWVTRLIGCGARETHMTNKGLSGTRLVIAVCTAQVLVQIGAFFWPVLLPTLVPAWHLTNAEAGWITAAFYGAYMVAVPILVTLTDRIETKHVYLLGVACTIAGHLAFGL